MESFKSQRYFRILFSLIVALLCLATLIAGIRGWAAAAQPAAEVVKSFGKTAEDLASPNNTGMVTGTVYAADGATPLSDIWVSDADNIYATCTDENGRYTLENLPMGEYKMIALVDGWNPCANAPSRYRYEYYSETLDIDLATPIVLSESNDTVTDIDFTLDRAGVITGTVYTADGITPLPDIWVTDGEVYYANCTGQSGQFGLGGLPFGEYKIVALVYDWNPCTDGPSHYRHEFYSETMDSDTAIPIVLSESNDTATNIDFTLDRAGVIVGTVYAADGITPLPDMWVSDGENDRATCTDQFGRFGLGALPFGEYTVAALIDGWNPCADAPSRYRHEYYSETLDS
ncbi:MAG: hypothetical protein JSW55_14100, partial [Chloroflexota bacterium]